MGHKPSSYRRFLERLLCGVTSVLWTLGSSSDHCSLKNLGTDTPKVLMSSSWVVERLDVVRNVVRRNIPVPIDFLLYALFLEAAKKRFGDSIIPTIAPPAHAGLKTIVEAEAPPVIATVLAALIGMYDRFLRLSFFH